MEDFEYSIQLSDKDWEKFFVEAEQCSEMQPSLATTEDLPVGDPDLRDFCYSPELMQRLKNFQLHMNSTERTLLQIPRSSSVTETEGLSEPAWYETKCSHSLFQDVLSGLQPTKEEELDLELLSRFMCTNIAPTNQGNSSASQQSQLKIHVQGDVISFSEAASGGNATDVTLRQCSHFANPSTGLTQEECHLNKNQSVNLFPASEQLTVTDVVTESSIQRALAAVALTGLHNTPAINLQETRTIQNNTSDQQDGMIFPNDNYSVPSSTQLKSGLLGPASNIVQSPFLNINVPPSATQSQHNDASSSRDLNHLTDSESLCSDQHKENGNGSSTVNFEQACKLLKDRGNNIKINIPDTLSFKWSSQEDHSIFKDALKDTSENASIDWNQEYADCQIYAANKLQKQDTYNSETQHCSHRLKVPECMDTLLESRQTNIETQACKSAAMDSGSESISQFTRHDSNDEHSISKGAPTTTEVHRVGISESAYFNVGPCCSSLSQLNIHRSLAHFRENKPRSSGGSSLLPCSSCKSSQNDINADSLPDMYEYFLDDDTPSPTRKNLKEQNISASQVPTVNSQDQISYSSCTPDMYEYFFTDDEMQNDSSESESSSARSSPDITATGLSLPEMYEYFLTEKEDSKRHRSSHRPQPEKERSQLNPLSIKTLIQKHLEQVKLSHLQSGHKHTCGTLCSVNKKEANQCSPFATPLMLDEQLKCMSMEAHEGSIACSRSGDELEGRHTSRMAFDQTDMCLACIALASWATKSANLQSKDTWKTALLANIGAVSAIRYFRRHIKEE
ncbi:PGC-1 and ERR-induced regulator in muscle protein 1 [Protopterus annectens]|uniref:PGC-1 and ERR-induced regulator in muscle protein 1 n=1 Tax=Protopterus annectens TaxID=7888 RepID=UPI001CFA47D7|nr:PGC-1 and ERR-induced regulator in muscle protein 1 [Protopterus annectens]